MVLHKIRITWAWGSIMMRIIIRNEQPWNNTELSGAPTKIKMNMPHHVACFVSSWWTRLLKFKNFCASKSIVVISLCDTLSCTYSAAVDDEMKLVARRYNWRNTQIIVHKTCAVLQHHALQPCEQSALAVFDTVIIFSHQTNYQKLQHIDC